MLAIVGVSVEPKLVAFATSLLMIFMNIASFISSPFIQLVGAITGDAIMAPIWVGFAIFVVCAVLLLVVSPYPKDITEMLKAARKGAGDGEAA